MVRILQRRRRGSARGVRQGQGGAPGVPEKNFSKKKDCCLINLTQCIYCNTINRGYVEEEL